MTPEQWQRVRPILESALDLNPASRASFLDGACADSFMRREVESLIASHEQAGTDALNPVSSIGLNPDEETRFRLPSGKRIGAYEILEELAVGGMGAVYRAVRADGQYEQRVALKIVRSELGAEFTAAQFKNERQILASLNHPNIAKILDGGTTAEGVPYFVMELVEGQCIDEYCDGHKLATTERLNLFLQICSAVQYAHQRLIIHRDIKPDNIMVDGEGVPKLLDFGIAKILESSESPNQLKQAISLVRLLTPEYASPEQVKGEPITTASDVYSLGVVLYELLTGRTPYNVPTHASHEISRAVCETEPEKPSTAVRRETVRTVDGEGKQTDDSALSANRDGSPEKLSKRLSGDLDNIVLMALRKEPERRYASVEQFAQDIRRHLEHLPVVARKDTFGYRTSKFITRHRVGVAVAALVTVAMSTATGVTLRQARIARVERARAERRFNDVRKLANSLIFEIHDSIGNLPGATPARKVLLDRALQYLDSLSKESAGDTSLQRELATAYQRVGQLQGSSVEANMGNTEGALTSFQKALVIWESIAAANPHELSDQVNVAKGHRILSMMLENSGRSGARDQLEAAIATSGRLLKSNPSVDPLLRERSVEFQWLSGYYDDEGDYAGAVNCLRNALAIVDGLAKGNPQDPFVLRGRAIDRVKMANELAAMGSREEALEMSRSGLEFYESAAQDKNNATTNRELAVTLVFRGNILMMNGDTKGALEVFRRSLGILEAMQRADSKNALLSADVAGASSDVGRASALLGKRAEGLVTMDSAIRLYEELRTSDQSNMDLTFQQGQTQIWRGEALARTGNARGALESYRKALTNFEVVANGSLSPKSHCDIATALTKIGLALLALGRVDEAATSIHKALELAEPLAMAKPPNILALYVAADIYSGLSDVASGRASLPGTASQKAVNCKEAHAWYEKSARASGEIPNRSLMNPDNFEAVDPALVRARLARCDPAAAGRTVD
jgi:eukaryotic-like serine/threonine-protein kinase